MSYDDIRPNSEYRWQSRYLPQPPVTLVSPRQRLRRSAFTAFVMGALAVLLMLI